MKKLLTVLVILLSLNLGAQNYVEHTVKAGETIESIAKQYMVTPFDIYALNPDAKTKIQPNSVLIIPDSKVKNEPIEEETKELIGYKSHKVRRKETLYGLSKKYNVSEEEIKKANRQLYSENLKKGDRIRIPQYKTIISKQTYKNTLKKYKVKPKEGKWRVAYKFGITVAELKDLNPGMNAVLQPGDELNVPNIQNEEERKVDSLYNYYEVLPKEGFYRLKVKTGLTQEQLENLNPELKESGLKAGMVLKIPGDVKTLSYVTDVETTNLESRLTNFKTKKIALMMPYQLHKIDVSSVEESKDEIKKNKLLSIVLDFHVGVRMALDSAKQLGISTDLKVLDTRHQPSHASQLLEDNDFSDFDAVIGPVENNSFNRVASRLRLDNIPVIAALNKPKELYGNVFQTIPEDKLLEKAMIDFIKNDSLKSKIYIISDEANRAKAEMLQKEFPSAQVKYARKDKKTSKPFFYPTDLDDFIADGKSIVFLQADSYAFASSVISRLNGLSFGKKQITLVTLNKNRAFEGKDIDNMHLSNLNFHYPSTYKDFDDNEANGFIDAYKREFGVSPSKYVARGFDITLDLLLRLASGENLYDASREMIETEYLENKFRYSKSLYGGYMNEAVYIVKYDDLKIVEADKL